MCGNAVHDDLDPGTPAGFTAAEVCQLIWDPCEHCDGLSTDVQAIRLRSPRGILAEEVMQGDPWTRETRMKA